MKTKHFLAVIAGVALASCVTDKEYLPNPQDEQAVISFSSPVMYNNNVGTRAGYHGEIGSHQYVQGGTTYSYPREESFFLFARRHTGDFKGWGVNDQGSQVDNLVASYDSSIDGWAPKQNVPAGQDPYYYWPDGYKLSVAACSPAELEQGAGWAGRSYGASGLKLTNFTVPSSSANHFDLMFSQREINKTKNDMLHGADYYSGLPIRFQHALSSIHFSLKSDAGSGTVVKLKKISLYGVYGTATFNENVDETDLTKYVCNPKWTAHTNLLAQNAAYVAFDAGTGEGLTFPVEAQYISNLLTQTGNIGAGVNNVLLVLPQELTDNAVLKIDYTVNGAEAHKVVDLKDARDKDDSTKAIDEWEIGTSYTYRLHYSAEAATKDKVYFSPSTDGWINAGVAVIDLASGASRTGN